MATNDRMLDADTSAGRGFVLLNGNYMTLREVWEGAHVLQASAMEAKLAGKHDEAVQLYKRLLSYVRKLDEVGDLRTPTGLAEQLVQRAIELAEAAKSPSLLEA